MRKLLRAALGAACALAVAVGSGSAAYADKLADIISKGVVRIGVPLDAPPFGSQDANRKPDGFDIEVAEMVAKALGVKLEMQQITGANRIPFLLTDKVDIVISVMGLTPERAKQIIFTRALREHVPRRLSAPKSPKVTSAADVGIDQDRRRQGHDPGSRDLRDEPEGGADAHRGRRDGCRPPTYPARRNCSRPTASSPRRSRNRTPARSSTANSSSVAAPPTWACAWAS